MNTPSEDPNGMASVYKTILLFLESQNLQKTYKTLVEEANDFGLLNVDHAVPKILVLKPCRCDVLNFPYNNTSKTTQNEMYILETAMTSENIKQSEESIGIRSEDVISDQSIDDHSNHVVSFTTFEDMDLCDKDNLSDCHEDNKGEICEQQTVQYCSAGESSSSAEDNTVDVDDKIIELTPIMSETTSRNTSGTCIRTYSNRTENNTLYTACSQADVETTNQQYFQLDYEKIKQEFRKGTDYMLICKLLQALRWRLTKSPPATKPIIITQYIEADLLGIVNNEQLIQKLYYIPEVQYCMARFVNSMASLSAGRSYLTQQNCAIVDILCRLLKDCKKEDEAVRDHILVTMQKLSLRKIVREKLINSEFVEFLIRFLEENYSSLSSYALEYTMALYMNLCLNDKTIDICRKMGPAVITLLINILNTRHEFCLPYITGSLYNLLADKDINKEAKDLHLDNVLEQHAMASSGMIRSQLEFILEAHRSNKSNQLLPVEEINENQEIDHIEMELDACDDLSGTTGEDLLQEYILLRKNSTCNTEHITVVQEAVSCQGLVEQEVEAEPIKQESCYNKIITKEPTKYDSFVNQTCPGINAVSLQCRPVKVQQDKDDKSQKKTNNDFGICVGTVNNANMNCNLRHQKPCDKSIPMCKQNNYYGRRFCIQAEQICQKKCEASSYNFCPRRWHCRNHPCYK